MWGGGRIYRREDLQRGICDNSESFPFTLFYTNCYGKKIIENIKKDPKPRVIGEAGCAECARCSVEHCLLNCIQTDITSVIEENVYKLSECLLFGLETGGSTNLQL